MKYYFFLDESGDHGLSYIDEKFPLFLLCGCLFSEKSLNDMENKINKFKRNFFKTTKVIIHSSKIRKCEGPFQILFNSDLKKRFYSELNEILSGAIFKIIAAVINKEKHIKKYGKNAGNPYELALSFIIERLLFCVNSLDKNAKIEIKLEKRGKREDGLLISHYNSIKDMGTYYVNNNEIKEKIEDFKFYSKKDNIIGLQIADLCAYPLARKILNPTETYIPYNIVKNKIYCNKKGEIRGWGLKIFP